MVLACSTRYGQGISPQADQHAPWAPLACAGMLELEMSKWAWFAWNVPLGCCNR